MSEIYSNQYLKISKNTGNNIFRIELTRPNPVLLYSLTKFVKGSTYSDDYLLFTFKAYSVQMFTSYKENYKGKLRIPMVANMVDTLAGQLQELYKYYVTFLGFNAENIIVINDHIFLCLDIGLMREVDEQNNVTIFTPFTSSEFFFSPELKIATKLPLTIHYKTSYFSLGCLLLYVLLSYDDAFYQEYVTGSLNMQEILLKYLENHPIKDTNLYWLIERCLVEEPEKRAILFI
jgi:hypothetical protein